MSTKKEDVVEETLAKIETCSSIVADLVYTIIYDFSNRLILDNNYDSKQVISLANQVLSDYKEGNVRVRKKPAPRARAPRAAKDKPVDLVTAARIKLQQEKPSANIQWELHPNNGPDKKYSFTRSFLLPGGGIPLKNNHTDQIVACIGKTKTDRLNKKQVQFLSEMGLQTGDIDS